VWCCVVVAVVGVLRGYEKESSSLEIIERERLNFNPTNKLT